MSCPTKIFQHENFYHESLITRIFLDLRYELLQNLCCFHFLAAASHESRPMSTLLIYNIILHTAAILVYSCPIGRYRAINKN